MDRRQTVLTLLKAKNAVSLGEVANHLGVSKQAAQRRLEALVRQGLVQVSTEEHRGPGRPGHVYRLTPAAGEHFPSGHRELAAELVEFVGERTLERFFDSRARRITAAYEARLAGLNFDERVRELARLTTADGHMTEVLRKPDGGLQLRHCNCPIQDVAARSGHPCRRERDIYQRLLGAAVARSTWLGAGDSSCTYDINVERKEIG